MVAMVILNSVQQCLSCLNVSRYISGKSEGCFISEKVTYSRNLNDKEK